MNKKIMYACAAVLGLTLYSCSVDPLEKDSKPQSALDSFKEAGHYPINDSIKVKSFSQDMESAENIDKIVDKGKKK